MDFPRAFAPRVFQALAATHPYGDAILGDLEEGYARVRARSGPASARAWYSHQALRSVLTMVGGMRVPSRAVPSLLAIVSLAYVAAISLSTVAAWALDGLGAHRSLFRALYLAVVTVCGSLAGAGVSRWGRPPRLGGALLLLALSLSIGALHVGSGGAEMWFRAGKVALFGMGIAAGCVWVLLRGGGVSKLIKRE